MPGRGGRRACVGLRGAGRPPTTWPTCSASASGATTSAPVSASALLDAALRDVGPATGCCSRCAPTTRPALAFYARPGSRRSTGAAATTATAPTRSSWSWTCVTDHRSGGTMTSCSRPTARWCSASRPPATRPASASSAATPCSPTRSPPASRSTPGSAASCPRSPAGRTSRRWCRRIERACDDAGVALADVDAIAVTAGPGLAGALLVGVAAAKALRARPRQAAVRRQPPRRARRRRPARARPAARAVPRAAGLRRALVAAAGRRRHRAASTPLGATIDDAAGEAFDKVARLLGLPFPGGPHIDRAAARRRPRSRSTSRAGSPSRRDLERHRFDFSFSGLKTAVARWVEARERAGEPVPVADVAASLPGGGRATC